MQGAVRLEKVAHMELLLEVGVDPKVLADGDVDVPGEDGIGNISPVSIAIKKNIFICCGRGCEQPTSSFSERGIFGIFKKSQIQRKQTEKIVK